MDYKSATVDKMSMSFRFVNILRNIFLSYIITFILFLIFAFLLTYTEMSAEIVSPIVITITVLSIMLAGILNGKKAFERGWLTGLISGGLYMFILYIIGSLIYKNFALGSNAVLLIIIGMLSGAIAGIIGINNRKNYRR